MRASRGALLEYLLDQPGTPTHSKTAARLAGRSLAIGTSLAGSTTMSAPIFTASSRRLGEKSAATIGRMLFSRSAAITASPTGPQPTTSGASSPLSARLLDRMHADGQRLGERRMLGRQAVGHFEQQRRGQQHLLGIAADKVVGVAHALGAVGLSITGMAQTRVPGLSFLFGLGPVVDHLAAELVAEDDVADEVHRRPGRECAC